MKNSYKIFCPHCQQKYDADERDIGSLVVCSICKKDFLVSAPPVIQNTVSCLDCGGKVSKRAEACPHCGCPCIGNKPVKQKRQPPTPPTQKRPTPPYPTQINMKHQRDGAFGESFGSAMGAGFGCLVFGIIIFVVIIIVFIGGCASILSSFNS